MKENETFIELLDEVESFGEYPKEVNGLGISDYLKTLTGDERGQLETATDNYAELSMERFLDNFYGGSEPVTVKEMQRKAHDEKMKLK